MDNCGSLKPVEQKKQRSSNLELFRIISMILIIAHHYVINSGLYELTSTSSFSFNSIFLLIFSAWGKMGINCFLLITGYFMCKSKITLRKYIKLLFEVMFYKVIIYLIFLISGYESFSLTGAIKALLPFTKIEQNFTGCFLMFYLCIPFLTLLVNKMSQKMHIRLLVLLFAIYVFFGTVPKFNVSMNYVSWYMVLFFLASYVRMYPIKLFNRALPWGLLSIGFVATSILSIFGSLWLGQKMNVYAPFLFMTDSNNFLALATGFSLFMFFKNIKMKNIKFVNIIASATFGVLLIHANGDTMRRWLWVDFLKNTEYFDSKYLVLHAVASVACIYVVCTLIELVRIYLIEKYVLKLWDKLEPKIKGVFEKIEKKITKPLYKGDEK